MWTRDDAELQGGWDGCGQTGVAVVIPQVLPEIGPVIPQAIIA
jgi:hypothetical protein